MYTTALPVTRLLTLRLRSPTGINTKQDMQGVRHSMYSDLQHIYRPILTAQTREQAYHRAASLVA